MSDIDLKALREAAKDEQGIEGQGWAAGAVREEARVKLALLDRLESAERRAEEAEKERDELLAAVCEALPCSYYMDPPDGGSVEPVEQLARMAQDAARYRWLKACNGGSIGIVAWHRDEDQEMVLTEAYADNAIDAAMAQEGGK